MMRNLVNGAVGGALGTAVMSAVMMAGDRAGVMGTPPPKRIMRVTLPGQKHRPKPGEDVLATIAHYAFGSTAGAVLGLVTGGRRIPLPLGAAYGLAIYIASYQGWVPRMGALPPATRDNFGRQAILALGHIMYGTSLAISMNRLKTEKIAGMRMPTRGYEAERVERVARRPQPAY
ncbi:DUF1440 domain-containing protein [Planotetraspora sp. A-T 1434]|uniref:DUF1440 domain-containing protein n=1 Tax=Planotetraspora sp. A-T 1434 TaxID=2979219 RepID=UPI0021BF4863|nr:DUF1440 domain-containing protein [Planotetraspora sp. A-T 1434]MCT9930852.1 DUF1440 domain-containing protein [Planotetraspora sp. A-T 1434]